MAGTFSNLLYHVVFSTKNRAPLIGDELREPLYHYIGGILRAEDGALLEIGGVADHVHLLVRLRPSTAIAEAVRLVKANSSKWVHEERKVDAFGWQTGYGAFTVSESQVDGVRRYIRRQPVHHRRRTFEEEMAELLRRHGIAFEERYLVG